jgi:hypothetical protein
LEPFFAAKALQDVGSPPAAGARKNCLKFHNPWMQLSSSMLVILNIPITAFGSFALMPTPELMLTAVDLVARAKCGMDAILALIASLALSIIGRIWPEAGEDCSVVKRNYFARLSACTARQHAAARKKLAEARILEAHATKAELQLLKEIEALGGAKQKTPRPRRRSLRNRVKGRHPSK